jgi:hypothetical protein
VVPIDFQISSDRKTYTLKVLGILEEKGVMKADAKPQPAMDLWGNQITYVDKCGLSKGCLRRRKQAFAVITRQKAFALANPGQKYQVTDVIAAGEFRKRTCPTIGEKSSITH